MCCQGVYSRPGWPLPLHHQPLHCKLHLAPLSKRMWQSHQRSALEQPLHWSSSRSCECISEWQQVTSNYHSHLARVLRQSPHTLLPAFTFLPVQNCIDIARPPSGVSRACNMHDNQFAFHRKTHMYPHSCNSLVEFVARCASCGEP